MTLIAGKYLIVHLFLLPHNISQFHNHTIHFHIVKFSSTETIIDCAIMNGFLLEGAQHILCPVSVVCLDFIWISEKISNGNLWQHGDIFSDLKDKCCINLSPIKWFSWKKLRFMMVLLLFSPTPPSWLHRVGRYDIKVDDAVINFREKAISQMNSKWN